MSRRVAREIAFKTVFQYDQGRNEAEPVLSSLIAESDLSSSQAAFARELALGVIAKLEELDELIRPYLKNWQLERLAAVDKNILRLAVYELIYHKNIPVAVTINEALELCKIYHDEKAAKFLNGVLDKLAQEKTAGKEEN
ncbi:MAG: transcription antitermination factor NusB [Firmicutes bacterium]|nr:transcription antitermination factor NusB [Bacillota bacterium]